LNAPPPISGRGSPSVASELARRAQRRVHLPRVIRECHLRFPSGAPRLRRALLLEPCKRLSQRSVSGADRQLEPF
jgi:hypothetical protein